MLNIQLTTNYSPTPIKGHRRMAVYILPVKIYVSIYIYETLELETIIQTSSKIP